MSEKKRRFKPDVRRAQIIEVTRQLILDKGLAWASMLRISKTLNVCKATLYYHFKNRRELLSEIFEEVVKENLEPFNGDMSDVADFIRESGRKFFVQTKNNPAQARLFFELLSAPQDEHILDEVQKHLSFLFSKVETAIREGIRQGVFREDTDVTLVVWELISLGMATIAASMRVLPNFISLEQAMHAIDLVLDSIKKPPKRQYKNL